ncbi:MAG TPA: DUF4386 family protein, partial [bacterium]|nr:DUF4386 family protein [bacterium]
VALYPVVRKQGEARAIGFIAMRVLEAATIYVGIVSLMSIVMLRRAGVGPSAQAIGQGLAALYQQTFFFAQSLIPAINGVLWDLSSTSRGWCRAGCRSWRSPARSCLPARGLPSCLALWG